MEEIGWKLWQRDARDEHQSGKSDRAAILHTTGICVSGWGFTFKKIEWDEQNLLVGSFNKRVV